MNHITLTNQFFHGLKWHVHTVKAKDAKLENDMESWMAS